MREMGAGLFRGHFCWGGTECWRSSNRFEVGDNAITIVVLLHWWDCLTQLLDLCFVGKKLCQ